MVRRLGYGIATAMAATVTKTLPRLIPRAVLFGNPKQALPTNSPDGRLLAYLAPDDRGVLGIWVRSLGLKDDRLIASDPARPITNVLWQSDGEHLLFQQDRNGDENSHVYQVAIASATVRDLTPFPGVRATIAAHDPHKPDELLVQMNRRNPALFDVHRIRLSTGEMTLDTENPGDVAAWAADNELTVRAAVVLNPDASALIRVRDEERSAWRLLAAYDPDDGFPEPRAFSADNHSLFVVTSHGWNAGRLLRYSTSDGSFEVVFADPIYDTGALHVDPATRLAAAVEVERERSEWVPLDDAYREDFAALARVNPGDLSIISQSDDARWLTLAFIADAGPVSYHVYDRRTRQAQFLFVSRPELQDYALAPMQPVAYEARDGLTIYAYLTLPVGIEPRALPMVVLVHGGPWARDSWGFRPDVQWLANRGYAVLQPNFRSSTGFGKAFLNSGDRQWAGAILNDVLDAKAWAIRSGYADPARVAIMGGSFGGYATLAALAFCPDEFACGVDIVGPSNLNTLLASIPPYWETERAVFLRRMGDSEEFLASQSPLFKADRIRAPLLIAQGRHDPRVKMQESDQIVAAMRRNGQAVEYIVFDDEGHGFARPENNQRFYAAAEAFLGKHLGGRVEPASAAETISANLR